MKTKILLISSILTTFCYANWNIETPSQEVPKEIKGSLFGKDIEGIDASWSKNCLTLKSTKKAKRSPESELMIFIKPDGTNEWLITPSNSGYSSPHIHMRFAKEKGEASSGILMFTGEYSMYLKLISKTDDSADFEIHVSLPDYKKSYLIGSFTAKLAH